jgi:hypothetical protein
MGGIIKHEFGIIDSIEKNRWYSEYEPVKYNCVSVSDDLIEELITKYNEELMAIKTYFQVTTQPGVGLDYCGVTLIPPESLKQFRDVIIKANSHYQSQELKLLIDIYCIIKTDEVAKKFPQFCNDDFLIIAKGH